MAEFVVVDEEVSEPSESLEITADSRWSVEKEDNLVTLWGERPCLYDVTSADYSNRILKAKMWDEIATALEMPVAAVQKRCASLRTQYTKARKSSPSGSARKNPTRKEKWLLEKLQFLNAFISSKKTASNLDKPSTSSNSVGTSEDEDDQSTSAVEIRSTKRPLTNAQKRKEKVQKKVKEKGDEELNILQGIAKSLHIDAEAEKDASVTFGTYVTQCLWKLNERSRLVVRHQIENILFQAQMGDMVQAQPQQLPYQHSAYMDNFHSHNHDQEHLPDHQYRYSMLLNSTT